MSHLTGVDQPGSTQHDSFTWTVLSTTKDVGGGVQATQIQTITDDPANSNDGNIDFWHFDSSSGNLYDCGFHNGVAYTNSQGTLPPQDIILSPRLLIGGQGMHLGDSIKSNGIGSFKANIGILNNVTLSGTVDSTVTLVEVVPSVVTPMGRFDNVLHLNLTME